ncbi:MAG: trypsin-like peptidase domain-containing protein [Candidatus Marinimicrobia bacterium]|nr:trypsin-like peptidase domain-containing protein [Candidatus Neomarinimicrobiota bacterium]
MNRRISILLFALMVGIPLFAQDIYTSRQTAITRAVQSVSPAVASINVVQYRQVSRQSPYADPFFQYFFPYSLEPKKVVGSGSGVVISPDGYVMTNNHVVENASEIIVTLPGGVEFPAELIGSDKVSDLAILKLDGRDFPYAKLGNSDDLIIGEWIIALGNPYGLFELSNQPTATAGIVSATNMNFGRQKGGQIFQDMIQTDASINRGNSGGPLVNANGEVIGINTFIYTGSDFDQGSIGIGFAIPINHAKEIAEELKNRGRIDRSFSTGLHVQPLTKKIAGYLDIPFAKGVIIVEIEDGSTAGKAGLKPADVIVSVNKVEISNAREIFDVIEQDDLRPGDKITLDVYRDGKQKKIRMELGKIEED